MRQPPPDAGPIVIDKSRPSDARMSRHAQIQVARRLNNVRYEIRGPLAQRAHELEAAGHEIVKLNIGNPAAFGFRVPETVRAAMVGHLAQAEGYCHQKGLLPAREAVASDFRRQGVAAVTADDVFMGNGVSELITMTMEALLEPGDEVLVPSPDYPLWTAAVHIAGGRAVHYPCRPSAEFIPDPEEIARMVTPRCRALVLINPNNPTGAVYPADVVERLVRVAEERGLIVFADEIYNRILYDGARHTPAGTLCRDTLCATFGGLSKVYLASGFRAGWVVFSGRRDHAADYLRGLELLASLRLCANVPAQWAVQAALDGAPDIYALTAPGGRLGRQRRAVLGAVSRSSCLTLVKPAGALYAFVGVDQDRLPWFDDAGFAMRLLEQQHVLIVPGSSFNVGYKNYFRVTFLPHEETIDRVFTRIEAFLVDDARSSGNCRHAS